MKTITVELSSDEAEYLVTKLTGGAEAAPNDTERFWMTALRDRVKDAILSRDAAEAEHRLMSSTGFGQLPAPPLPLPPPPPPSGAAGFSPPSLPRCSRPDCALKLPHPAH